MHILKHFTMPLSLTSIFIHPRLQPKKCSSMVTRLRQPRRPRMSLIPCCGRVILLGCRAALVLAGIDVGYNKEAKRFSNYVFYCLDVYAGRVTNDISNIRRGSKEMVREDQRAGGVHSKTGLFPHLMWLSTCREECVEQKEVQKPFQSIAPISAD